MRYQFCTLFDRNYVYKGLALYGSLLRHCPDFVLWILCMDDRTYEILGRLKLEKAVLIRHDEFEDAELLLVKPTRTTAEYCWTCTPSLPLYLFKKDPSINLIAYLDADLFFFSDPAPVYDEFGNASIMIIEHRFPDHLKHLEINGIYNVQMLIFRRDDRAMQCLAWWRERCIEWCFYRLEEGRLGDQKYLDDWPARFPGVHVLQHKGAGVALWNIMRYRVSQKNGRTYVDDQELVFYHFHAFSLQEDGGYGIGNNSNYPLTIKKIGLVYRPYVKALHDAVRQVRTVDTGFKFGYVPARPGTLFSRLASTAREMMLNFYS
jgi:hypothetical protein